VGDMVVIHLLFADDLCMFVPASAVFNMKSTVYVSWLCCWIWNKLLKPLKQMYQNV